VEDSAGEDGEGPTEAGLPGQADTDRTDLQQTDRKRHILDLQQS